MTSDGQAKVTAAENTGTVLLSLFIMVALCNRADHTYFHPVVCSFFFFSFLA